MNTPQAGVTFRDRAALAALLSATGVLRAVGPRISRPPLAALGDLYARAPMNRRRFSFAVESIRWCFPDLDEAAARGLARSAWRHLFMLAAEVSLSPSRYRFDRWPDWIEPPDNPEAVRILLREPAILVTGHCGNWEIMGAWMGSLGLPINSVYRPLPNRAIDEWVRATRARLGITLINKFGAVAQLPDILKQGGHVSFIIDEDAGERGVFVPYFDRLASTHKSVGLLAMRMNLPVLCGGAIRIARPGLDPGPLSFRIHVTDIIRPDEWRDEPDPLFTISARCRRAIESLIRIAPEQHLWMHKSWRRRPLFEREARPFPQSLRAKIERLPWMTPSSLDRIIAASAAPAETARIR